MTTSRRNLALFLFPAGVLVLVFLVVPLVFIGYMSFFQWRGLGAATFVGVGNYQQLFDDNAFTRSLTNTIGWVLVGAVIHTPLCIIVALVIRRRPTFWRGFRTIFFLPNVVSTTALAMLWYFLLDVKLGLVNNVLSAIGLGDLARPWLFDPGTALPATQLPFILYIGFGMVLFLAQMSTIPREVYEAAEIDGASGWRLDWAITVPLIRPAIATQLLLVVGYTLKMFEYPYIMTGGGPANLTSNLSLYMYREMVVANQYGMSMAAGVVTVLLGAVLIAAAYLFLMRMRS